MSAVLQNLHSQIHGCNAGNMYFLNLDEFNKMDDPFNQGENQFEFYDLLVKTKQISLDIFDKHNEFNKLKSRYDPNCESRSSLSTIIVGLNKIMESYNSFSNRKFKIMKEFGGRSYTLAQQAIYQANLNHITKQMDFFENVTQLTGQITKHRDNLPAECIIL
jgi:hypothetical protein